MDSPDNQPTVLYTMEDLGLTPHYLKMALEDLANDQIEMEATITSLRRTDLLLFGGTLFALFGVGVLARMQSKLAGALQQIGQAVLSTQQHVGMLVAMPEPVPQPPVHPNVQAHMDANREAGREAQREAGVSIGEGYDPGPQPIPDTVREAVEAEPVDGMLDEPL